MNGALYSRYPLRSIVTYNGLTLAHFLLGAAGFMIGYRDWPGYLLGSVYLAFALIEMYLVMPLKVCPNCVYYRLENSVCISGLNLFSRKVATQGNLKDFEDRARGFFCANNLYLAGLALPVIGIIPALFLNFSLALLIIFVLLLGLLLFRFFVVFPKIACNHCRAKNICPNARQMGLGEN
jgi:hypothetical protein